MISQFSPEGRQLGNTRSVECLQLDFNSRQSKKHQIKLLNAKLRKLKNKCKLLRQQSKTQREMLSNLMNQTHHLESKANEGIQACKQVCTQILDNNSQLALPSNNQLASENIASSMQLILQSNCEKLTEAIVKTKNDPAQKSIQGIHIPILKFKQYKQEMNIPTTERSVTSSLKSEGAGENIFDIDNKQMSTSTIPQSGWVSQIKRSNTISYSTSQIDFQTQNVLRSRKRRVHKIKPYHHNMFQNYIFAVVTVIILTIILKLTFF